jgi:hypothetical protein
MMRAARAFLCIPLQLSSGVGCPRATWQLKRARIRLTKGPIAISPALAPETIMKRSIVALLMISSVLPSSRLMSQSIVNATSTATIAPNPADVTSVDAIIAAVYDANTNLVDQKRDADRYRSLFVPGARLMPTSRPSNGKGTISIESVDDYVRRAMSSPRRHGFNEREIARTTEAFGSIVQVFSTYETHVDSADTHPHRGINSIQLFNDGARWWIVSVLWAIERPDQPIPTAFLKRSPVSH